MEKYYGVSILPGIAIGKIYWYRKQTYHVVKRIVEDKEKEKIRLQKAIHTAKEKLTALYNETNRNLGREQALIFEIHKMLLEDIEYQEAIKKQLDNGFCAEYAVETAMEEIAGQFALIDDEILKSRVVDIRDVSKRVIHILADICETEIQTKEPVIVVAEDLSPSETIRMDKSKIIGLVTIKGAPNSHTAILARSMNIPALVGTQIEQTEMIDGKLGIIDGISGTFLVEPKQDTLQAMEMQKQKWMTESKELELLKGKENKTADGRSVKIYANIGNVEDAEEAIKADAGGIGLFRSEFLYLGREELPSEEEQFACYKAVLQKMENKKVIIRTMDIGVDKKEDYFQLEPEENPALGYRAIRISLDRPQIFKTQLRAIYRAAVYGNAAIMFPMITTIEEIKSIKKHIETIKEELQKEGYKVGSVTIGIMIETPAAAIISDELAKEVEFFSIGTNDLTQYTLAVDRQNRKLEKLFDTHHPAILKLIELTVRNAHAAGIEVGICGEMASDESLTRMFMDWGVDELSVAPSAVLKIRKVVRNI